MNEVLEETIKCDKCNSLMSVKAVVSPAIGKMAIIVNGHIIFNFNRHELEESSE